MLHLLAFLLICACSITPNSSVRNIEFVDDGGYIAGRVGQMGCWAGEQGRGGEGIKELILLLIS